MRDAVSGCSFGFVVGDGNDSWSNETDEEGETYALRTIRDFQNVSDATITAYPAYPDTSVSARNLVPEEVLSEARARGVKLSPNRIAPVPPPRKIELVSPEEREILQDLFRRDRQVKVDGVIAHDEWREIEAWRSGSGSETPIEKFVRETKQKEGR
jgi:hypothetical protein